MLLDSSSLSGQIKYKGYDSFVANITKGFFI